MKKNKKLWIAFLLNFVFSVFEFVGGVLTGSIAISSDALHDLGDAISIGLSLGLERLSQKGPDKKYTYGYYRYSVLGGTIQSMLLLCGAAFVAYSAICRFVAPQPVDYTGMLFVAVVGFAVNFAAAWFTSGEGSLNQRAINLHMLEDVLGWAAVLVGAVVMRFTDWVFIDPALSLALSVFIGVNALKNLKQVLDIFLEKTPTGIDPEEITHHLVQIPGVESIHHLHIWSMDGYRNSATLHAVVTGEFGTVKQAIKEELAEHGIAHATVELERPGEHCEDLCCHPAEHMEHHHHHHH
jgi:cobalt-zinc-cadmium efflux system protein